MRRGGACIALIGLLASLGGCETPATAPTDGAPAVEAAALESIIDRHNERVGRLARIGAEGVIEYEWTDEKGKRRQQPQVSAKIWIEGPRRSAIRGEKLGETVFWLGSDDARYWMFLLYEASELRVGRHADPIADGSGSIIPVRPLALMDLLGLVPVTEPVDPATVVAGDDGTWIVPVAGRGGPARLHFAPASGRLVAVDTLDGDRVVASSTLTRYAAIEVNGAVRLGWTHVPTLIDVADAGGAVAIKIGLDRAWALGDDEDVARLFDLDVLRAHFAPTVVVDGTTTDLP